MGGAMGGATGGTPAVPCDPATPGALILNEALVDAVGAETANEYIELVNVTDREVSLAGVALLHADANGALQSRLSFASGCVAPRSALAVYSDDRVVSSTPIRDLAFAAPPSFTLANTRDARLELRGADGVTLSALLIPAALIAEGVSANRNPDATPDAPAARHTALNPTLSTSPSLCPNGARYEDSCVTR
jgi:hypothetical protein